MLNFKAYKDGVKNQFAIRMGYKLIVVMFVLGLATLGVLELQENVEVGVTNYMVGSELGANEADADYALKAQSR